jgi:Phage integrase, N-terminal SAM-like domain/Family of unknown function (DUF6796)
VTHLRQAMLEELQRRNYAKTTVYYYLKAVERFAKYFHTSPDQLNQSHLRQYQAYLLRERKLGPRTVKLHVSALRFFFVKTLKRPYTLLVTAFSIAPFVHGSFFYVAEILKTVGQVDPSAQSVLVTLATRATVGLFIAYGAFAVLASVGFAWLTVAIARGKTLYPRWVALANPLVCMLAGLLIDRVLPQPFKRLLAGAGLSLGLLVFFALSTAVLWSSPLSALQAPKSPSI